LFAKIVAASLLKRKSKARDGLTDRQTAELGVTLNAAFLEGRIILCEHEQQKS